MNAIRFLLEGEPEWFVALLGLSLQAAILTAVVFAVIKLVGRWIPPAWRALLWFLVMVRVLVPFSPSSAFSMQNLYLKTALEKPAVRTSAPMFNVQSVNVAGPVKFVSEIAPVSEEMEKAPVPGNRVLANVWMLGVGLGLAGLAARYGMIRRQLALRSGKVDREVIKDLAECRAKMRSKYPVRVAVSDRIAAPALSGLFPAQLLVPGNFAEQNLSPQQVRHVLMHELAHLSQGHLILHWLSLIARALHWFNPLIHFAAARLREECELAADAAALKDAAEEERRAYGETILKVLSQTVAPSSQLALGMAEQARHLEKRLRALTAPSAPSFRTLGILVVVAIMFGGLTGAEKEPTTLLQDRSAQLQKTNSIDVGLKMEAAKALLQKGNLMEARDALEEILRLEPTNRMAMYYLNVVHEISGSRSPQILKSRGVNNVNPFSATNLLTSKTPRIRLRQKLESIRIDDFPTDKELELMELLKDLGNEAKRRDPQGRGVNLLIANVREGTNEFANVERFRVKFDAPLRDLTLREFLDRIVMVAKPPLDAFAPFARLKYSVEDYAVVFIGTNEKAEAKDGKLYTRTYRLDPKIFQEKLRLQEGDKSLQKEILALFTSARVDFGTNVAMGTERPVSTSDGKSSMSQKALFFNDAAGVLFVRATLEDLDKIENALHSLNREAAQIAFEVRVFEMPAETQLDHFNDLKATREVVTTNEYLFVLPKGDVGSEARVNDAKELVKKLDVPVNSMIATARSSEYIVRNERAKQIEDGIGVLPGVEKLALPQLTTAVGRLSIISRQDTITVVTENAVVKDDRITDGTVRFEFGTMVWLKPALVTEQSMVFKATFNFPQFLGYAKETEKPLPRMRIRSTEISTEVRHGHTQVIVVPPHVAKAPMADDRRYVIFLTPTVIDSRGMAVFK